MTTLGRTGDAITAQATALRSVLERAKDEIRIYTLRIYTPATKGVLEDYYPNFQAVVPESISENQ